MSSMVVGLVGWLFFLFWLATQREVNIEAAQLFAFVTYVDGGGREWRSYGSVSVTVCRWPSSVRSVKTRYDIVAPACLEDDALSSMYSLLFVCLSHLPHLPTHSAAWCNY